MRSVLFALVLSACTPPAASPSEVDANATTAKENAMFNARKYRADAGDMYADWKLVPRGDSSITPQCPAGDGWATIEMYNSTATGKTTLKCSTWSSGRGCVDEQHFKGSPAATEDGQCQAVGVIPNPLIRIAQ